jgi:hypothetical protein
MRWIFLIVALAMTAPALAQEPAGCDKFKWPIDKERALLASAAPAQNGAAVSQPLAAAFRLALAPTTEAALPKPPTRTSRAGTYAGFVKAAAPPRAGTYRITLSAGGWIDVFQNGTALKSGAFTGATGCDGIRKSVKFDLAAMPFVIELSGVATDSIAVVVTPD